MGDFRLCGIWIGMKVAISAAFIAGTVLSGQEGRRCLSGGRNGNELLP
jgi:hypothetical protein